MLVSFDFDGSLARSDPFVQLAEQHGAGGEVAGVLDRMYHGDTAFEDGLRTAVGHLEGLPVRDAEAAIDHVRYRPGAGAVVGALRQADHHVAIISDAPERAVEACLDAHAFDVDTVVANRLPVQNEALTGDVEGAPIERSKSEALERLAVEQGRDRSDVVAVGGDKRDLGMLQTAGVGIGVDPEPTVATQCDHTVTSMQRLEERFEEWNLI